MGHKTESPTTMTVSGRGRFGQFHSRSSRARARTGARGSRRGPGRHGWTMIDGSARNDSSRLDRRSGAESPSAGEEKGVPDLPRLTGWPTDSFAQAYYPKATTNAPRVREQGRAPLISRPPVHERTTLLHALWTLPRSAICRVSGCQPLGRAPGPRRDTPWTGGVHIRFAGRPEPMVWRPSGESCFMVWTRTASAVVCLFVVIAPPLNNSTSACLLSTGAVPP